MDRNGACRRLPVPRASGATEETRHRLPTASAPPSHMRLATRLFASIGLLVAAAVAGSIIAADVLLRRHLEHEIATELEREARLVAAFTPADSTKWPEFAALAGARLRRRVTLIDPDGHVRGDTEFDRASLAQLQNHRDRPEVRAVLDSARGVGVNERLSTSTNERQMYVAIRDGPPGLAVVRVSTTLAIVDAQVHAVQRAVAAAGLVMLLAAGLVAWLLARALAWPLVRIAVAARETLSGAVVEGRELDLGDRTVVVSARPLAEGGTLLVLSDVTDLRRLETIRRDFVANVSHELKTPLTAIAGYAETLAAEAAEAQAVGFAQTIVENARRMQRLVDDLLDLSRIESGGWEPQPRTVGVEAAAREAWRRFTERAADRGVLFETAMNEATISGDPDALQQIFTNLFDNALRHTPRGGRIRVAAERDGGDIVVRVTDTGSGIPAEHLPRIFERFYRVDPGRSRQEGGTGLGLSIVKHLVEAHGGRVEAESELGRGTTVVLFFPSVTHS